MISSKVMRLMFTLATCTSVLGAAGQAREPFPKANWQVKYQSGSLGSKEGTWLRIAFVTDEHARTDTDLLTVLQEHITAVRFSAKAEKDSDLLEKMPRSGCAYARGMMPKAAAPHQHALLVAPVSPGAVSRFAEKLTRRHSIRLVWNDGSAEQFVVFGVNDCEYASFLANLRELLGSRWQSIQGELSEGL